MTRPSTECSPARTAEISGARVGDRAELLKMAITLRSDGQVGNRDTFHNESEPDLMTEFVLANAPVNISAWGGERLQSDSRWQYCTPSVGNASFS